MWDMLYVNIVSLDELFDWKELFKKFNICFGVCHSNWIESRQPIRFADKTNTFF